MEVQYAAKNLLQAIAVLLQILRLVQNAKLAENLAAKAHLLQTR